MTLLRTRYHRLVSAAALGISACAIPAAFAVGASASGADPKEEGGGGDRRRGTGGTADARRRSLRQSLAPFADPKSVETRDAPPASPLVRPNILYLVPDQWNPEYDGLHPARALTGESIPLDMPFLRDLASNGMRFTQAYVPSPYCGPSRACLANGKEYDATSVLTNSGWGGWGPSFPTVYKQLRDVGGYWTMTAGKDDLYENDASFPVYPEGSKGHEDWEPLDVGFSDAIRTKGKVRTAKDKDSEPYSDYLHATNVTLADGTIVSGMHVYAACMKKFGKDDAWIAGCDGNAFTSDLYPDDFVRSTAIQLLDRKPNDRPWFLQVNFPGPHQPIVATSDMAQSVLGRTWPRPVDPDPKKDTSGCPQQERMAARHPDDPPPAPRPEREGICNYAAELENLDGLMSSIVSHVASLGELENTLVIVSGDHGDMLGDNGLTGKGVPWRGSVTTPLFVAGPGLARGVVHDLPAATLDLGGTWLDYAGIPQEEWAAGMTTTSLRPILEGLDDGGEQRRTVVSTGYDDWRAVVRTMPTSPVDASPTSYKLVCCRGTPRGIDDEGRQTYAGGGCDRGAPVTATPHPTYGLWRMMLYDTMRDPDERVPLESARPDVVEGLVPYLPEGWCRQGVGVDMVQLQV